MRFLNYSLRLLILVFVVSCSSDSSTTINPDDILLKSVIKKSLDSEYETFYTYAGKKLIQTKSYRQLNNILYNGDKIVEIKTSIYPDIDVIGNTKYIFQYDTSDRLIKINDVLYQREIDFTYNNDNNIDFNYTYLNPNPNANYDYSGTIIIENGEIHQVSINDITVQYIYDNKNNPLKNVIGLDKLILFGFFAGDYDNGTLTIFPCIGINHNLINFFNINNPQSTSPITTYEYNSNDFPKSKNIETYKLYYN